MNEAPAAMEKDTSDAVVPHPPLQTSSDVEFKDRDPQRMNQHLMLAFSDVFGEPEPDKFSFEPIWSLTRQVFAVSRLWCYRILSAIFAIPFALWWGICFACFSLCSIWCCVPCIRGCQIQLFCVKKVLDLLIKALVAPFFEAFGKCLSSIRITTSRHHQQYFDNLDSVATQN